MRIFNEEKTQELFDVDYELGYVREDRILKQHHEAIPERVIKTVEEIKAELVAQGKEVLFGNDGSWYVTLEYFPETDGRNVEEVKPVVEPAKEAWDEYEDIQVYIPFTEEQVTKIKIAKLKQNLFDTDYKAIKYAEGYLTDEEYEPIKEQRQAWRDEINTLEDSMI